MPVNTLLQLRRGTASQWVSASEVLGQGILYNGEIGYETDTGRFKIGDGTSSWSDLSYGAVLPDSFVGVSGLEVVTYGTGSYLEIGITGVATNQIIGLSGYIENVITNSENTVNLEGMQDVIGLSGIVGGFGINKSYDDVTTGFTTVSATGMALRVEQGTGLEVSTSTENNNNVYTVRVTGIGSGLINEWVESVQDTVGSDAGNGGFLVNGSGVEWTYDDSSNTLELAVTGIPHTLITDWDGALSGNIDTQLLAGDNIDFTYDNANNTLTISTTVLDSTHTHVWDDITDAKTKATLTELGYLSGVVPGTASADRALVVDSNKDIQGIRNLSTDNDVTIGGDLIVRGASTVVNSTTVDIGDNIIQVNVSGSETQGGFQVLDHDNSDTLKFVWDINDSRWEFEGGTANVYTTGNIEADTFTSSINDGSAPIIVNSTGLVENLTADYLDGEHGSFYRDWINITGLPSPTVSVELTGDVTGSASVSPQLGGNIAISIATTSSADSIELGADTTGDYVESIDVAGTGLSIDETSGEGSTPVITSNATPVNTQGTLVARDTTSGGFSAGNVDLTRLDVDDLRIDGSTISVQTLDEDIHILTSGNGNIIFGSPINDLSGYTNSFLYDNGAYTISPPGSGNRVINIGNNAAFNDGSITYSNNVLIGNFNFDYGKSNVMLSATSALSYFSTMGSGTRYASLFGGVGRNIIHSGDAGVILGGANNDIYEGNYAAVLSSRNSSASGNYGIVLGGYRSHTNGYDFVQLLGSGITATQSHTTFVENLISFGDVSGVFIGDGSSITDINADNISTGTVDVARLPLASTLATGIAVFSSNDFAVNGNGLVTIKGQGVSNSQLVNDSMTFGTTVVALGDTVPVMSGLTAISGVSMASATYLYNVVIDGGTP